VVVCQRYIGRRAEQVHQPKTDFLTTEPRRQPHDTMACERLFFRCILACRVVSRRASGDQSLGRSEPLRTYCCRLRQVALYSETDSETGLSGRLQSRIEMVTQCRSLAAAVVRFSSNKFRYVAIGLYALHTTLGQCGTCSLESTLFERQRQSRGPFNGLVYCSQMCYAVYHFSGQISRISCHQKPDF